VAAVSEFLASGQPLHAMRDHPKHKAVLLGGMWDANLTSVASRQNWKTTWQGILKDPHVWSPRDSKGLDQNLLYDHVWKVFWGHKNTLQHDDSLTCAGFRGSVAWPIQRLMEPNNFVGSVKKQN